MKAEQGNPAHQLVSRCEEPRVTEFIQRFVPTAYLKSESQRELHYILPNEEARKRNFEKLFVALESGTPGLHVAGYGIVDTTLEEIFLTITESAFQEEGKTKTLTADCFEDVSLWWFIVWYRV